MNVYAVFDCKSKKIWELFNGECTVLAMAVTKKGLINTLKSHDCQVVNRKKVISFSIGEIRKVSLASVK